jgi:hypothetical protein
MPLDEIAGAIVGEVVGKAAGVVVDVSLQLIFNKYVARYFHGLGRHTQRHQSKAKRVGLACFGRRCGSLV